MYNEVFDRDRYRLTVENALYAAVDPILNCIPDTSGIFLEVGCGTGYFARKLMPARLSPSYVGIDMSSASLNLFREQRPNLKLIRGDVDCLPFPQDSVDNILGFSAYPILNDEVPIAETSRVLKPGGRLVIIQDSGIGERDEDGKVSNEGADLTEKLHQELLSKIYQAGLKLVSGMRPSHGVAVSDYDEFSSRVREEDKAKFLLRNTPQRTLFGYSSESGSGVFQAGPSSQLKKWLREREKDSDAPSGTFYRLKMEPGKQVYEHVRVRFIVAEKPQN